MTDIELDLKKIKHRVQGLWFSITCKGSLWVYNENEINYLMGGHATELVHAVPLPSYFSADERAKIYGVVGKLQENGRYVWIYLYYRNRLWKCDTIKHAYELIEKLNEHNKLQKMQWNLRDKVYAAKKRNAKLLKA